MAGAAGEELRVSRVGKRPVEIPKGVTVALEGAVVKIKGPKGELSRSFHADVEVVKDGEALKVVPATGSSRRFAQYQGLTRALLRNMLRGVSEGYKLSLDLYGVGYRATLSGQELTLNLGLSHQVVHPLHPNVKAKVEIIDEGGTKRPRLHLESHDKEALGQTAAKIRSYRPPEPYKGKGVRYTGERIREKAGKAGGK
ncbi:MAG: 50S ribosomal protein L6 [Sandaracinaceae bacterium]|nr:50S ribosomal protein L6 [Sandaracinaceae bacterium]